MENKFKLSTASNVYRGLLIGILVIKASLGAGLTPESRGALIANLIIYIWLLPFIVVKVTTFSLSGKIQPFIVLNYDRIVNTIFKVFITLFFLLAL